MKTQLRQVDRVERIMLDGKFHTIGKIANKLGIPETSASARLRDLRKSEFGGYEIEKDFHKDGYFRYRLVGA